MCFRTVTRKKHNNNKTELIAKNVNFFEEHATPFVVVLPPLPLPAYTHFIFLHLFGFFLYFFSYSYANLFT